ncbi:hypothetical protein CALVIDRAFT_257237 [Calocera viscosa TUFC12733]|uniref:F-box domain-containing protein n=1 Tax=Calocera viscosa (strain TUFC12733) TaxID=1330018 RepID=A0A167JA05_CALVF|nr:hypothetical protein CALVIDRAFT_257237 [Calocera viscosa TUFC12733]
MYNALELPELVLVIVDFLADHLADTYHLGRTCRTIWQTVEPVIWRNCANAKALRGLLPEDIGTVFGLQSRLLKDHEWSRLLHYGQHIQQLELIEDFLRTDRVQDILICLRGYEDPMMFMPNLRSLHLVLCQRHSLNAGPVLLQWPLTNLCIHVDIRQHVEPAIIKALISAVRPGPHMQELRIILEGRVLVDTWSNLLDTAFSAMLPQLTSLRNLHLKTVTDGVALLPLVANLPVLQSFDIVITSDSNPLASYELPAGAFPSLRSLKIDSEESFYQPAMLPLLQCISSPALEELQFFCEHTQVLRNVTQLLSDRWSKTIASLRISMSLGDEPKATFAKTFFSTLSPLLHCPNMRSFWLISDVFIPWSDERLEEIITAWPSLEVFWIDDGWAASQRITPFVTRSTIVALAQICLQLTHLRLSVDYNLPPVTLRWTGQSQSRLAHLHTDYSLCSNPVAVADFLRRAFPRLEGMTADGSGMIPVAELFCIAMDAQEPPAYQLR